MAEHMSLSTRSLRVTSSSVANLSPRAVQASGPAHPGRPHNTRQLLEVAPVCAASSPCTLPRCKALSTSAIARRKHCTAIGWPAVQQLSRRTPTITAMPMGWPPASASTAKGSTETDGLRAVALPLKAGPQGNGVRLAELRAGTHWQTLTHSPRQVRAAAVHSAACTPVDAAALPAAGLQPPARGASQRPLAVAAARPSCSTSQRTASPVRWRSAEAEGVLATAPRPQQLLLSAACGARGGAGGRGMKG